MAFDPDAFLVGDTFDPDAFLGENADLQSDVPLQPEQVEQLTPEQQKEYFGAQEKPERSVGERIGGAVEAVGSLASAAIPGTVANVSGGLYGIGKSVVEGTYGTTEGAQQAAQTGQDWADAVTVKPVTEAGQESVQATSEFLEPIGHIGAALSPMATMGLGSLAKASAPQVRSMTPLAKAATKADDVIPERAPKSTPLERQKIADVRQALKENTTESVGWKLKGNDPVPNMVERDLLDMGVDDVTLTSLRQLKKQGRSEALRVLDLAEDAVKGKEGADLSRPSVVAGEQLMKRVEKLAKIQDDASSKIRDAVRRDLAGKPVDVSDIAESVSDMIRENGGIIGKDGSINLANMARLQPGDKAQLTQLYRALSKQRENKVDLHNLASKSVEKDAARLHDLKRTISDKVYGSITGETPVKLSTNAQDIMKSARGRINEKLRAVSPDYASANDDFAKAIQPMNEFKKAVGEKRFNEIMGKELDLENTRISDFTGTQLRKILSNNLNTDQLITAVENMNRVANEFPGVKFNNEIVPLVRLNSDLEGLLGSFAKQSFQGVQEKAMGVAGQRALGGMAELAQAGLKAGKRRTSLWDAPVADKVELINKLREQVKQQ